MTIEPGQIYRSCDPRDIPPIRVSVAACLPGSNRVDVVDAVTGKRPRSILATAFHDSPLTRDGKPRRTGYVLEQP
ncbi:hypothetical protein OG432_24575 [Streptomyces sp. NBC_00442]|uniref:hypothetical protein n=1 Tax=Streptomyces sp. NBC_00442 TaxID=2903651 RepID=UPI002E1F791B